MDYHDIGVTICNTIDKCSRPPLTEDHRTALIASIAVWLDKQHKAGYEAGLRRAVEIGNEITSGYYQHAKAPYGHYQQSILAEIKGE